MGALATARRMNEKTSPQAYDGVWNAFVGGRTEDIPEPDTGAPEAKLRGYLKRLVELPEGFNLHRNLRRFIAARAEMAEGKRPARLGRGRGARLRGNGRFRPARTAERTGLRTWNLQPAPFRAARPRHRREPPAALERGREPGGGRDLQQPAVGGRRARLRVRLQPRLPGRTGALGSAVRRLRERGAG